MQALPPAEAAAATERFVLSATAQGSAYSALQVRLRKTAKQHGACNQNATTHTQDNAACGPLHSGVGCTGMHKHKPVTRIGGGGRVVRHTTYSMAYITYRPIQHGCRFASGRGMAMVVCLVDDSRVHRVVSAVSA